MTAMLAIVAALLFADGQSANAPAKAPNVIFVCEHGAAKSVIATASGKASDWSDVPDDQGYAPMRDAIVRHVTVLLDDLEKRGK